MKFDFSKPIILDGATGTELQKRGLPNGACAEAWNIENPEAIKDIKTGYINAGSNCVYAPTFGANRVKLKSFGVEKSVEEVCTTLVKNAREFTPEHLMIGGDMAPCGLTLLPYGEASPEDLIDIYREQAEALEKAEVDFFVIETQMSIADAKCAVTAVQSVSEKPIFVSFAPNPIGRTVMGDDMVSALLTFQEMGVDVFGVNCISDMDLARDTIIRLRKYAKIPLLIKPNAGMPDMSTGEAVYHMGADEFTKAAVTFVEVGASLLGGCCGTHAEHIAKVSEAVKGMKTLAPEPEILDCCASPSRVVDITEKTVFVEKPIDDDLEEHAEDVQAEGGEVMKLHIKSDEDLEIIAECQYAIQIPLCVSFENEALKPKFQAMYNGKAKLI